MTVFDFSTGIKLVKDAQDIVVCGHVNPDGDSLGSTLALVQGLREMGLNATALLATRDKPACYAFLTGYDDLVCACDYKGEPGLFISVDVPSIERTGDGQAVFKRSEHSIAIDHHQGDGLFAEVAYIDESAAAAGVLVWEFLHAAGCEPSAEIANCCFAALITDTGCFQYQNTDARALRTAGKLVDAGANPAMVAAMVYQNRTLASLKLKCRVVERARFVCDGHALVSWVNQEDFDELGAAKEDGEDLIDIVRQVGGIEVAAMLRGQGSLVRGSLRAKGNRDVSIIAAKMGGGGHKAAAGFTIKEKRLDKAMGVLIGYLDKEFGTTSNTGGIIL